MSSSNRNAIELTSPFASWFAPEAEAAVHGVLCADIVNFHPGSRLFERFLYHCPPETIFTTHFTCSDQNTTVAGTSSRCLPARQVMRARTAPAELRQALKIWGARLLRLRYQLSITRRKPPIDCDTDHNCTTSPPTFSTVHITLGPTVRMWRRVSPLSRSGTSSS
jgi:hypothetical protein